MKIVFIKEGHMGFRRYPGEYGSNSSLRISSLISAVLICTSFFLCVENSSAKSNSTQSSQPGGQLRIVRINPSGQDVPPGRQIVFEFGQPVVPLGRMERKSSEIPITIEPALDCQWRWLNSATLACQLNEKDALKPATRYSIVVRPGLRAEDGATLDKEYTHSFITQRPQVSSSWFKTWLSPGAPQIGVRFNQQVQESSVAEHLYFKVKKGPRFAVTLSEDPDYQKSPDYRKGYVWLVTPQEKLPEGRAATLGIEPGIVSLEGPEPGVEKRSLESFYTFPKFSFFGIRCETNAGQEITIQPSSSASSQLRCDPTREISLIFSSPVFKEEIQKGIEFSPSLTAPEKNFDPWENVYSYSRLSSSHKKNETYPVSLPDVIKPYTEYHVKAETGSVKDEFNRPLNSPVNMTFKTDHLPPDFFLFKRMAVLEKGLDSEVPLAVTNLDRMQVKYDVITNEGKTSTKSETLALPKAVDTPTRVPLGIRNLLGKESGIVEGELTPTPPVPGKEPSEGWFFAQVTPFAVHVKLGHYNTTVWVTDLKSGQPVPNVTVQICKDTFTHFAGNQEILSEGTTDQEGLASVGGTNKVDPELKLLWAYKLDEPHLFVRCQKDSDLAVLPLTYDFRVDAEGANREYIPDWIRPRYGHIRTWGTTAQGIYKVGDMVQYKIYVRDQNNRRFVLPPGTEKSQPDNYTLKVIDPMDKVIYERRNITLSDFGACDGDFSISQNGAVGWYRFEFSASFTEETWEPMRVLVSDFTPSPFKVSTDLNGKQFAVDDMVKVETRATLHAGGPYANAAVRVTATLDARPFETEDPKLKGYQFDILEPSETKTPPSQIIYQTEGKLDDHGTFETEFKVVKSPVLYGRMTVESAVRDDRGKFVADRATAAYIGRDRYVGLLQKDWVLQQGSPASVFIVVVDDNGLPVAETAVDLKVQRQETKASRVKEAGDAYITQYVHEWVDVEKSELKSALEPVEFEFTPEQPGTYRITAEIQDTLNRPQSTTIERWAVGSGQVLWETTAGNMMNVFPEKESYQVGETARFLAQNPFPGAKALITVERFGVLQSWVKTFNNSTEVIEVPVQPDYLPGFYLSVLVMSPRVEKPAAEDSEDLGKPTFVIGYVKVPVKDPYKEIDVTVKPQKETYKPGDEVTVDIQARPLHPSANGPSPPIEIAVTVLDESVFDLLMDGRKTFDPYGGFYNLDPLDVANYDLIMQLVGRAKLEKKGASPGGGGGPDLSMRSIFKFVSYWNPSIPLGEEGKTQIRFKVPDNLTGWRVLVLAASPEDLMGLGDAIFRVNQSTEIRPALPNQVTAGDNFDAEFSIMNRMEETRTLEVSLQAEGPVQPAGPEQSQTAAGQSAVKSTQQVTLKPYERTTVFLPVKATGHGEITFMVRAWDDKGQDGLTTKLSVARLQSPQTVAAYGSSSSDEVTQAVKFPQDMQPESGGVAVTASPTIIGGLEGTFQFLREYPYGCWEQKLSKGLAAAIYQKLKPYLKGEFSWENSQELPKKTLNLAVDYQAPNGGMTFYLPQDEYVSPYLSAFTALAFNWLRQDGYLPPQHMEAKLHEYLESLLQRDAVPDLYTKGMTATLRAVILAALTGKGGLNRTDVERFAGHVQDMSLFGKAMYLQALIHFPAASKLQKTVLQAILAHADQTSGTLTFNETLDLRYKALLTSPIKANCAILSALLQYLAAHPQETELRDMPLQLARSISRSRKGRDHWVSTQESLFALKALEDFSTAFEAEKPDMTVQVSLDSVSLGEATFHSVMDPPRVFDYAAQATDAGRKAAVKIRRSGIGRLFYSTALTYTPAALNKEAINSGIEVHREYSVERDGTWMLLQNPVEVKSGELVRVDLYVLLPAARYFVVVDDPVPGGLEPINQQLATTSSVDAAKASANFPTGSFWHQSDGWLNEANSIWSFYHKELRQNSARFYSEYLAPGNYHLSYVAQAIAPGQFTALPLHAEEMYEPDVFGKGVPAIVHVSEGK